MKYIFVSPSLEPTKSQIIITLVLVQIMFWGVIIEIEIVYWWILQVVQRAYQPSYAHLGRVWRWKVAQKMGDTCFGTWLVLDLSQQFATMSKKHFTNSLSDKHSSWYAQLPHLYTDKKKWPMVLR